MSRTRLINGVKERDGRTKERDRKRRGKDTYIIHANTLYMYPWLRATN